MEISNEKFAELRQYLETYKQTIEDSLRRNLPLAPTHIETEFNEACEFAVFSDEERFRPILTLLSAELIGGKAEDVLPSAIAVEFIHTSSKIFDSLPSLSNRERKSENDNLSEKFSEGLAVLVGLGFLNASYPLVFVNHSGMPERALAAHAEIVECVGSAGLVGGQSIDMAFAKGVGVSESYSDDSIRNLKTSALMRLALRIGAILSGANYIELASLSRFAELLGDAYQVSDDIISFNRNDNDSIINEEKESARLKLLSINEEAKRVLVNNFPSNDARTCMIQMIDYLAERGS